LSGSYRSHVASFIGREYPPAGKARYRAGGRLLPFPYKFQQPRIPALGFGPGWLDGGDLQGKENNPALDVASVQLRRPAHAGTSAGASGIEPLAFQNGFP